MNEIPQTSLDSAPRHRAARTGKIARLPAALRKQVNERLYDGELGAPLIEWLNTLPEVQAVLDRLFEGRPINEQNLSEWRTGGFQDWLAKVEADASLADMLNDDTPQETNPKNAAPTPAISKSKVDRVADWFFPHFVLTAHTRFAEAGTNEARWETMLEISHELTKLRRIENNSERARIARERQEGKSQPAGPKLDLTSLQLDDLKISALERENRMQHILGLEPFHNIEELRKLYQEQNSSR